ncbi:hypothetical protein HDV01_002200 [Terramyces sp. JEL0728]|nr:hypothetical protein HDV01_002200 [Terramyces sp. JEL0728]
MFLLLIATVQALVFQYYGGPILHSVQVVPILLGRNKGTFPFRSTISHYYSSLLNSTFISKVQEYSVPSTQIITGKAWTPKYIIYPSSTIDDTQIQAALIDLVGQTVISPSVNTLYVVHASPGINVTVHGRTSCSDYCAYHSNVAIPNPPNVLYYVVVPYLSCSSCNHGLDDFNSVAMWASKEVAEGITDPYNNGWSDPGVGDIGQPCIGQFELVDGLPTQKIFSNQLNSCH